MILVAYLRDSGGDAQDLSISQQENEIRKWAAANGSTITRWFRDVARPGSSTVGRDGFQAMMAHFRQRGCQESGVVIWKMSRFSRDIDDAQFYRADLRRRGFRIISLNDNIPDGAEGRLYEAALDWMNHRFIVDLSTDVRRGLRDLVQSYGAVPGTPPRGFKREPIIAGQRRDGSKHIVHRWVPDPDLVPLVRLAFEMKAAGNSIREIQAATGLYKNSNSWTTFFRNPLYIGRLHYGDLVVEDYCDPIVPPDVWHAVQAQVHRAKDRQHTRSDQDHPRRKASSYLLSGLAFCARCGSPLSGLSRTRSSDGSTYRRYACSRARRRKDCDLQPVPAATLEQAIIDELRNHILTPEMLLAQQRLLLDDQAGRQDELTAQIAAHRTQLAELRRQITRLTDAIAAAGHSRALLARLAELEGSEADHQRQIAILERQAVPAPEQSPAQMAQVADNLQTLLENGSQLETQAVLRGLIARVDVDRDQDRLYGQLSLYFPPAEIKKKPPDGGMSIIHTPVGAPEYRHTIEVPFAASLR